MTPKFSGKVKKTDPGTTVLRPALSRIRSFLTVLLLASPAISFAISPVLTGMETSTITYSEGAAATSITSLIAVADADSPTIAGATVQITGNLLATEDLLIYSTMSGITGSYDASSGTLTLTGPATLIAYRDAIRSVKYQNSNSNNPSVLTRTISVTVNDGTTNSNTVSRNINVVAVNDAPLVSGIEAAALTFTEGDAVTPISATLIVSDVDNTNLTSATVAITGNFQSSQDILAFSNAFGISGSLSGSTLTLTGSASVSDYQAALRTVSYLNTNTVNPNTTNRTITVRVNDGALQSTVVTRTITVVPVNDAPVLSAIEGTNLAYSEGGASAVISSAINAVDGDDANLAGAIIKITTNYTDTEDVLTYTPVTGITGTFDASGGIMTLSGTAPVTSYRNALRAVRYSNTNNNDPSTLARTVSFTIQDASANSNTVTRNITVTPVNDAPVASGFETTALSFTEGDAATPITASLVVQDADNSTLTGATVVITGYVSGQDLLAFTSASGITGSWSAGTLTLSGSAATADYQAALRSVTYQNTNTFNPSAAARALSIRVNDGALQSTAVTRTLTVTGVNDGAVLSAIEATNLAFTAGSATPVAITATLAAADDNANLQSATVQITTNYVSTEDVITYTIPGGSGITASFDAPTGTLTFSGSSTVTNYQTALRSVRYRNSNSIQASPLTRTVSFSAFDGTLSSNTVSRLIVVAAKRTVTTDEETVLGFSVAAYDATVNSSVDAGSVVILSNPANGAVSVNNGTGVVTYTPNAEFSGVNTMTYTIKDLNGVTSGIVTATINVNLINDAPSFISGTDISVDEDAGTQTIAGWATNINDGDPFTSQSLTFLYTNSNPALFSSVPSISTSTGNLTFKAANNASGVATVTVTLRDGGSSTAPNVNSSDTKTFTITVMSVNDAPVGVDEFFSTSSNTLLTANAKANDTDVETDATILSPAPLVAPAHGSVAINSNGTFTYTPDGNFTGSDFFIYQVCDNGTDHGIPASRCGQAVVNINVNPQNANWNIVGNNSIELGPNEFILTKALNNQQGAIWNRNALDLHYSFDLTLDAIFSEPGVVHDDGADGIVFVFQRDLTPPPLNVPDLPIYARGQNGGSLGVGGITPSLAIEVDTYQNGGEVVYDHIAINKDGDVYNNLAASVAAKIDGSGTPLNIEDGVWHNVNIHWDYPAKTLSVAFDGVDKIVYTNDIVASVFSADPAGVYWGFSSGTGGKNNYQAVKDMVMTVINLSPVTDTDYNTVDEDAVLNGSSVLANDYDPEATTLTVLTETKATAHGQVEIHADGTYLYTPALNYTGQDSFTYQVCDSYSPAACSTGTVNITVNPVQDAPVSNDDLFSTNEDTQLIVTCDCVLRNDTDADGETLTATIVESVKHGTLNFNPDGTFTYMPDKDYFGTDTFTYYNSDGTDISNTSTATIIVVPVNDPPVAVNDQLYTDEDVPAILPILGNDIDVDDVLVASMVTVVSAPAHGTVSINVSLNTVTYTPAANYFGNDSFTYTVTDASAAVSSTATVTIGINPVNDAPVAGSDSESTNEDTAVFISVLVNDTDIDNALDATSVKIVSGPAHGVAIAQTNGSVQYTPEKDFFGTDVFSYTVQDVGGAASQAATVTVTVTPVNDAPVAVDDAATTLENTAKTIAILANDLDVDDALVLSSVVITLNPAHGTVAYDPSTGEAVYTPETDFLGNDQFTYTIQDPAGLTSAPASVHVSVIPPNRAPVAVDDGPITLKLLLDLPIDVMANDYDVDNAHNDLTLVSVTQPAIGSVSIVDGQIVYHPEGTMSATVTFTYTIMDPAGLTDQAVVTIEYIYNALMVSEGFSPNNDANNDTWYILSIENYPNNSVKVFDRWGLIVYQKEHYENSIAPWDGRSNTGQQSGKLLDQGTYYYMLETGGELKMLSGYVMIVR